jgi:hypothetical protein
MTMIHYHFYVWLVDKELLEYIGIDSFTLQ